MLTSAITIGTVTALPDRPLRVVHYVPGIRLEQGGVVRAILDWCEVFARRGHRVALFAYQGNDIPPSWTAGEPGCPVATVVPAPRPPLKLLNAAAMAAIDAELSAADVLHLHGPWLDGNRQIADLAGRRGVPVVVSLHGMLDHWSMAQRGWKKRAYLALLGRRWLGRAAVVHCTAEDERDQAARWFTPRRTAVLPYVVDLQPFETLPPAGLADDLVPPAFRGRPRVLFVSRLHEKKGTDRLIGAAGLLRDAGRPFTLLLAGTGEPAYERMLRRLVADLNLGDHVHFLGLVTGDAKLSLYASADLFVLPTREENFGLVLTEAMACGTAVVTTRGTAIWRDIEVAGGVVADGSVKAIAAAVGRLLDDPADRVDRATRGRRWVFAHLAVDPLARRYEALYRSVLTPRATGR